VRTKLKSSIFIAIIIIGMFSFIIRPSVFLAGATYVEGPIVQDTVWTLVDSPFVVSKNVTVYDNATLTIEPGVEVRFGGDFSIVVLGQLIADGAPDRMITFTSNKYQPETGDWGTIEFLGTQHSLLAYCSVTYAKVGITTQDTIMEIRNSIIGNNQQYGISITNSTVGISANEITNNSVSGISITNSTVGISANEITNNSVSGISISGDNHATIQNNTIKANGDGILLNGTTSSGISIIQNSVLSNIQSGIHLNANAYSNLTIFHNIVSANKWGFYISGQPSTTITNNSISYNKIGLLYIAGQNHQAHWNNITNNVMGMELSPAIGSHSVFVQVTDSVGMRVTSNIATVSTSGALSAGISPGYTNLAAGQSQVFNSSISGGTPPYSYQWYLNGNPVANATGTTWTFTPYISGNYLVYVNVTDYVGLEVQSNIATVTVLVSQAFSAGISPGYTNLAAGQSQVFNSSISGGTPPYSYQWYVDGIPVAGATEATWTFVQSVSEVVSATYNYWGNESGPYHVSLNPAGKGNPVGGDGADLEFIFWCKAPIGYIDHPPLAWLWADKKLVSPNQLVTFFATNSSNDRNEPVDQYFFDFGDGQNSGWTTLSVFVHKYSSVGTYNASVKVMDDFTMISNNLASWQITCQELPPLTVSLTPSNLSTDSGEQVSLTVQVTNATSPVDNASLTLLSILGGHLLPMSGFTNSSGCFKATFYAPNVTSITNIRIVVSASKAGYADGSDYKYILIQPPLTVNIASPNSTQSETNAKVEVQVMYSGTPVPAALVTISSNSTGGFSQTTEVTDANGTCTFVFTAPQTSTLIEINITATATKSGYLDGQGQALLAVQPNGPSPAILITRDTIWTLVDSPIIISNDVIVYPNATLTIEPGVEVRFGENLSLIVNGQLIANGLENEQIRFTSNKFLPQPGDWNGILFSSVRPSQLAYCTIEYAKIGINVINGIVQAKNSMISNNSEGISIENSLATFIANEITNNTQNGIYITGNNSATLQNNTITSNGDGIFLSGNLSSVSITRNVILLNTQSGIHLNGDAYKNVTILYNVLSANNIGFYVDGQASTYISNNSVSYNTVGFSYEDAADHVAHWNDIYGNEMGMEVLSGATVDATYNYWGDPSGPYHASLNPTGKGNPVNGNGVDLKFIFYLTAPIGYINQRPVARLVTDVSHVSPNQQVMFFATNSTDDRRVDMHFFDFGDGQNSGWTTLSVFVHKYSSVGTYNASVKVMDDFGVVSINMASLVITCQTLPPLTVSLIPSSAVVGSGGQVSVTVQVKNATSSMSGANVTLFSILGGSFLSSSGETNSAGLFTTTFLSPSVTALRNIRIVASASNKGYVDGSDYKYILIQPPLIVNVTANPGNINSEATTNVTITVTCNGVPVSGALVTVWSNSTGRFSAWSGVANSLGFFNTTFFAPYATLITNVRIVASASMIGFANGSSYDYLLIEPPLMVNVSPSPARIKSEATASVSVYVTYDDLPFSGANIIVLSNSTGIFDRNVGVTDANGTCTFVFTAPQTTSPLEIDITAKATKGGYLGGQGESLLSVQPKVLVVQVLPSTSVVNSEMPSNVTVLVVYNGDPVPNATVALSSVFSGPGASFSPTNAETDVNGEYTFIFTAPQVVTPTNVTIIAIATETGYASGTNQTIMTVNLGRLNVQVSANPTTLESKATSTVTVDIMYNAKPVANAVVIVSSEGNGAFAVSNETSNENGECTFIFTAPQTSSELPVIIMANVTKFGYVSGNEETTIMITPEATGSGWSILTIFLILIPILIAAIVILLIKLKIISITFGEEQSEEDNRV
jgi:parallel beta-helix repeat protein